jgi:hypothetical protein
MINKLIAEINRKGIYINDKTKGKLKKIQADKSGIMLTIITKNESYLINLFDIAFLYENESIFQALQILSYELKNKTITIFCPS